MKFELTEQDKKYIDKLNEAKGKNEYIPCFISEEGKSYYFEFKPIDIAKANAFASTLMCPNSETYEMLRDQCGIEVKALSVVNPVNSNVNRMKELLRQTMEQLDNLS